MDLGLSHRFKGFFKEIMPITSIYIAPSRSKSMCFTHVLFYSSLKNNDPVLLGMTSYPASVCALSNSMPGYLTFPHCLFKDMLFVCLFFNKIDLDTLLSHVVVLN